MSEEITKKSVEEWLNTVSYDADPEFSPSEFALLFIVFIKLVNGSQGEEHKSPVVHYRMLDKVAGKNKKIINMCSRGLAKTTVLGEYLFLYIAVYGEIPGFGKIDLAIYVSDSIENGVKNMRKNLEFRYENSDFLKRYIPFTRFTDVRWEFKNTSDETFIVKGYGAKALSLDTQLLTEFGTTTIGECKVGEMIFGADGKLAQITKKSEVFNRPMYQIELEDGRTLKMCEDHINSVVIKHNPSNTVHYVKENLVTKELLKLPLQHVRKRTRLNKPDYISRENLLFIENTLPLQYLKSVVPLDPYVLGLLLGDGSMKKDGSNVLHGHKDDIKFYKTKIPYKLGSHYVDKRNTNVVSLTIKGISKIVRDLGVTGHGDFKYIPPSYLIGSMDQRIAILQGLMDTDGSIQENGRMDFCSNSEDLVDDVSSLVRSLGGTTKKRSIGKAFRIEIWININIFQLPRKRIRFTGTRTKNLVAIVAITPIPQEPSQCIAIDNEEHQFLANDYFRTHNTGVRGAKEMGKRPQLAVLDDLVSDEDARSPVVIESIESTVNKAVNFALHPTKSKTIWSGTPFNSKDPLYKAVESGAWHVSVFPVCEEFPCEEKDFKGAWPDRFDYQYVKEQYEFAKNQGRVADFNQELMLRIMSDDDRVILDSDIVWYKRINVLNNKGMFNFYITTDFATSEKASADYSTIFVWAYNANGDWLWVDGICKRQQMNDNINDLFRLAQEYSPQAVGVEVTGQQGGFISWIQEQMMARNNYFSLVSDQNANKPGIRPNTNKMVRFMVAEPLFKLKKMWFPEEMQDDPVVSEIMNELSLISPDGMKSKHDDCIDNISMLPLMKAWKPSAESPRPDDVDNGLWEDADDRTPDSLDSYIV